MRISNELSSLFSTKVNQTRYSITSENITSNIDKSVSRSSQSSLINKSYSDTVTLSNTAKSLQNSSGSTTNLVTLLTGKGNEKIDLDDYFLPLKPGEEYKSIEDVPILIPSQDNLDAITKHLSGKMTLFLKENNIPEAPSNITYDSQYNIQLPSDYPYKAEFKEALEGNPALANELTTVAWLASHLNGSTNTLAFDEEFEQAKNLDEQFSIIKKDQNIIDNSRSYDEIFLNFDTSGELTIIAKEPHQSEDSVA